MSRIIRPLFNLESKFLHGHPRRHRIKLHLMWRHQLLPVGIYWSSKNCRKCPLWRLWVEFLQIYTSTGYLIIEIIANKPNNQISYERPYWSICSHTGYGVISYFWSAFIEVEKTTENDAFGGLGRFLLALRFACLNNWWAACYFGKMP